MHKKAERTKQIGTQLSTKDYDRLIELVEDRNKEAKATPGASVNIAGMLRFIIVSYLDKNCSNPILTGEENV